MKRATPCCSLVDGARRVAPNPCVRRNNHFPVREVRVFKAFSGKGGDETDMSPFHASIRRHHRRPLCLLPSRARARYAPQGPLGYLPDESFTANLSPGRAEPPVFARGGGRRHRKVGGGDDAAKSVVAAFRTSRIVAVVAATAIAVLASLAGCATPAATGRADMQAGAAPQSMTHDGVTVSVAVLTPDQARRRFGVDIDRHGVQAAWISVRNASSRGLWFIRNLLDPDFYSADEVASMVGGEANASQRDALRQRLRDESIRVFMQPATVTEGHLFLPRAEGGRFLDVRLQGDAWDEAAAPGAVVAHPRELRFGFAVAMPDGEFDFEQFHPTKIYVGRETPDVDAERLRGLLESLPCCSTDRGGTNQGDPLNVVLVGEAAEVMNALTRAGWSFTHRITAHTVAREIAAAVSGSAYGVAPVTSLYAFERSHDLALQRARRSIAQRNHMRLWIAPFLFEGRHVWLGQVSRDIGVKLTTRSRMLTTHVIDPEIDATREYLLHSLMAGHLVERFGFVKGSAAAPREAPRRNLTGDPYFSDGMRLVVVLAKTPVPAGAVRNLMWERSAAPIAEGQSAAARRNVRPIGAAGE
ncbi:MAG: LssY C-terminal domain-containing protein [Gammaproteobacteria bacterium]